MKQTNPNFSLTTQDVDKAIENLDSRIPQRSALCAELSARKLAAMEVRAVPKADFITREFETFLRFLKVNSIRTAMYHYEFYDEHRLELLFKLPETNINLFERRPVGMQSAPFGYQPEESDYVYYLRYTDYIKQTVDPERPRVLWLLALHQGYSVACRMEDEWLVRTGLPNVQTLMQAASNSRKYGNYEQGIIRFRFTNPDGSDLESDAAQSEVEAADAAQMNQPVQAPTPPPAEQADPDAAYRRILDNIEKGRHYQN
ncbi:MAG: hypothetical protein IK130_06380 [Oscillospiraceae bacterium]|nr:hypothetical protein [Oscillospiraceae bacterium]